MSGIQNRYIQTYPQRDRRPLPRHLNTCPRTLSQRAPLEYPNETFNTLFIFFFFIIPARQQRPREGRGAPGEDRGGRDAAEAAVVRLPRAGLAVQAERRPGHVVRQGQRLQLHQVLPDAR